MHAGDGAEGRAGFLGYVLAANVFNGIVFKRLGGEAALLRAVMNQAILADVEIARTRPAAPVTRLAVGDALLEIIDTREMPLLERLHLQKDFAFARRKRAQLAVPVVNDADGGSEAKLHRALAYRERIFRVADAAAEYGVDIDVEIGVLGQNLELFVQHLEALLRNVVGHDVIDADLQVIEPGIVEAFDTLGSEQIAVRDQAGQSGIAANTADNIVELGMEQRFAAAERDHASFQIAEQFQAVQHSGKRHRLGEIVVLVTVSAGKIAAPDRDDVRHDGMVG